MRSVLVAALALAALGLAACADFTAGVDDRPDNAQGSLLNDNSYESSATDNPILTGGAGDHPGAFGGAGY